MSSPVTPKPGSGTDCEVEEEICASNGRRTVDGYTSVHPTKDETNFRPASKSSIHNS